MGSLENIAPGPHERSTGEGRRFLVIALAVGLLVRLVVLTNTGALGTTIIDEQQYSQIARSLVSGDGFAWGPDQPTSIRPPLFPALLAGVWTLSGGEHLQLVRLLQIGLALATAILAYAIGARVYGPAVGRWAFAIAWLYPSLVFFNFLMLTETLFTFLLLAFLLLVVVLVQTPRAWVAVACGLTLGLGALTRSILWPLALVLVPLLVVLIRAPFARRIGLAAAVLAGFTLVVAPWAARNTRLQGVVTIVDTMGGMNLRMGNYEHTPDDRMWDAVGLTGEKSWVNGLPPSSTGAPITEGQKEKWAQRMALEYMRTHPAETLRRSFIKFADFWGLEREFVAGVRSGFFAPPAWFQVAGGLAIALAYVAVAVVGAAGIWLTAPRDWRVHALLLLPIVLITALHTIVFGHSRYHIPLMPIFGVYAAALITSRSWSFAPFTRPAAIGAAASVAMLLAVWVRQVAIVDLARISGLLHAG